MGNIHIPRVQQDGFDKSHLQCKEQTADEDNHQSDAPSHKCRLIL